VLLKKEELDEERLAGKVVVVLDVLFATSSIVTALAHGAREVVPALDAQSALAEARLRPAGSYVLSGELDATTLPGFAHPTPLALLGEDLGHKALVYSTTNGTVALAQTAGAARVYCGALLNARALCEHIVAQHPRETVLLVCSGSGANFNFEDFFGAGCYVERFAEELGPAADFSDAARAARTVFRHSPLPQALLECRLGRMMSARGLRHEVEFACRIDAFPVIPALEEGRLRLIA
jgi:2-phosphosulfolactate phosphatase